MVNINANFYNKIDHSPTQKTNNFSIFLSPNKIKTGKNDFKISNKFDPTQIILYLSDLIKIRK